MHKYIFAFGLSLFLLGCGTPTSEHSDVLHTDQDCEERDCSSHEEESTIEVRTITIEAERFDFAPSVIRIAKGETVRLIVKDIDTGHGLKIPSLGITRTHDVEFTADEAGEFPFFCATMCGDGHREMSGTLIIE
jgi:cytochrome c oxidase subunit II